MVFSSFPIPNSQNGPDIEQAILHYRLFQIARYRFTLRMFPQAHYQTLKFPQSRIKSYEKHYSTLSIFYWRVNWSPIFIDEQPKLKFGLRHGTRQNQVDSVLAQ